MRSSGNLPFESLVRERTGADFVERQWLHTAIDEAVAEESRRLVLVTGEPGSGKTNLLLGLAKARPDWLRHFIGSEGDDGTLVTGDIESFLISIGHQLARQRPELFDVERLSVTVTQHFGEVREGATVTGIKIGDLNVSPFCETARLSVLQTVTEMRGSVSAVEIGTANLEPRLLEPDNLAHLALIGPAEVLLEKNPDARIVILLDALDEATGPKGKGKLLDWLAGSARLPRNVRIVVTSRPHADLPQLTSAPAAKVTALDLDPASRRIGDDLVRYAQKVLVAPEILAAAQSRGLFPDGLHRQAARRANGNFLYLASYARALVDAVKLADEEMAGRLFDLDGLPSDLGGIYGLFVDTARRAIEDLGSAKLGDQSDVESAVWENVGQPLLGVLTVAREPLTEGQLIELSGLRVRRRHVRNVLKHLRWLIARRGDRIALFHTSVGEFLVGEQADQEYPDCWVDETEWHEQIVRHYRGSAVSWAEVDWSHVDRYGLVHLVEHVLKSPQQISAQAVNLVCPGLLRAVRAAFGAEHRFLEVVDRVAHHVAETAPVRTGLPAMMYLGVVRHQAAQSSHALPPRVLGLLARLGRLREALERAAGIAPSMHQFAAFAEILRYADPGPGDPSEEELLERVVECALAIPRHGTEYYRDLDSQNATETAARLLAPHDLDRAMRLWQYGQTAKEEPRARKEVPDDLYRAAAAAEQDTDKACAIINRIAAGRWADYLDLAERAEPGRVTELLRSAEACLDTSGPAARIVALARLASLWATREPDIGRRFLAEVRAQVFEAGDEEGLAPQLAKAAVLLADVDRTTARLLLSRLDMMVLDGRTERAVLDGAGLWSRWGSPQRAQAFIDRYLAWAKSPWAAHEALSALGQSSPAEELRLIESDYARIPQPSDGPSTEHFDVWQRDNNLVEVIRRMARHDLARAARIAEELERTAWSDSGIWSHYFVTATADPSKVIYGRDRYSILAGIAHLHIARGEIAEATAILNETLRRAESSARLDEGGGYGSDLVSSSSEPFKGPADSLPPGVNVGGIMLLYNLSHEWSARARGNFYRNPAEIIRAVELGSHSSMAKVVRGLAGRLAHSDRDRAWGLMRSIADPAERTIGFAELHWVAHDFNGSQSHHGPEADVFSREVDHALAALPHYRWTMSGGDGAEQRAWAYVRTDHRVHFELAVRALGCRRQDTDAIRDLPYLYYAYQKYVRAWASEMYATDMIEGNRPDPTSREFHLETLGPQQHENPDDALTGSARAAAAYNEFRIAREVPGYGSRVRHVRIENPIYAAVIDLLTPEPGEPLSPEFGQRVRSMLDEGPLPAAAQLLVFAAEARPEDQRELRELGAAVIAKADDGSAIGVDALTCLVESPLLGDLVDPVVLLHQAERCRFRWPGEHWIPRDVVSRLFPVLLERGPSVAMRKFYEVASTDWGFAMSLLEHGVDALIAALDADVAAVLASAVARGLACSSPDGAAHEVLDGVRLAELAVTGPTDDGRAS